MNIRYSGLLAAALVAAALPVAAQTVDHYDMSRVGYRNPNGQAAYPAGVSDPSGWNTSAPPMESAVPAPPPTDAPIRSLPGSPVVYGPTGASPLYVPGVTANGAVGTPYGSPSQADPLMGPAVAWLPPPASWYTRIEYFHWNEKVDGADFVNESGALYTLGYQRRSGFERYRAEVFGGEVHYDGYGDFDGTGVTETLASHTSYLGLRGEYEMVWEPEMWQGRVALLAGLGTRFWYRDLHDDTTPLGNPVYGYEETWWTIYPYLGAETHLPLRQGLDLYSESRVGSTLVTYNYATIGDRPVWPAAGIVANVEVGLRCTHCFAALRGEVMSWEESPVVQGAFQPRSVMYTAGGRLGFMF